MARQHNQNIISNINANEQRNPNVLRYTAQQINEFLRHDYALFVQNPQAVATHYAEQVINRFNNIDPTHPLEAPVDAAIRNTFADLATRVTNIPNVPIALDELTVIHKAAQNRNQVRATINGGLQHLLQVLPFQQNAALANQYDTEIDEKIGTEQEKHDAKVIFGMSGIPLAQINAQNLNQEIAQYAQITGHRPKVGFIQPVSPMRTNLAPAVQNFWELLVLTDAMDPNYNAGQFLHDQNKFTVHANTTLKGIYERQVRGLEATFGENDTAQMIAQNTGLTLTAAQYIHQQYTQLRNAGINLCHASAVPNAQPVVVYRPTAARVLLRDQNAMNHFFDTFCSQKLTQPQQAELREAYNEKLWAAAQDQIKQYFINLQEFGALTAAQRQDLERCAQNAPDAGGTRQLWEGLKAHENMNRDINRLFAYHNIR